MSTALTANEE